MKLPKDADDIALETYIYLFPLVLMDMTKRYSTLKIPDNLKQSGMAPLNEFAHTKSYPTANDRIVVRVNFDTLYSTAWLDLTQGPVELSVPDVGDRFYLMPMLDMWTDVFAVPGTRASGNGANKWKIAYGEKMGEGIIEAPTPYIWIIGRTQADGPDDYPTVNPIQDQYILTGPKIEQRFDRDLDLKSVDPTAVVVKMSAAELVNYGLNLLKTIPPHPTDWPMLARMGRIGLKRGIIFEKIGELADLFKGKEKEANKVLMDAWVNVGEKVNGWTSTLKGVGVYGTDYIVRASAALNGLGCNRPSDAVYPRNITDENDEPMVGEKNYVIKFEEDEIPPAYAFWSITMYDEFGFQVANEIDRFAVSSWMPFKKGTDGSIEIYIQHKNPGGDKEANWLPSPASGKLGTTMRMYWPKPEVLSGEWSPPVVEAV